MNAEPVTLIKDPPLEAVEDFYRLRREGIGFIERAGSARWTDYNVHDPGITILEALCYAITDIGYRLGWDIEDLLSPKTASTDLLRPYPDQAFYTAREILTVHPTTPPDLRRLLIDLPRIRNAWLICKSCACETSYFAWCENDQLKLSYREPTITTAKEVWAKGLYETLIELERDPDLGDLNDRMIVLNSVFHDGAGAHPVTMEMRFPDISLSRDDWELFTQAGSEVANVTLSRLGATKTFDVFTDLPTDAERDAHIRRHWRDTFYASFQVTTAAPAGTVTIENASLRVFADTAVKNATKAADLRVLFENKAADGVIQRYQKKARLTLDGVAEAKAALQAHRNLDEDLCVVSAVGIEDVAVCADVEVEADADIEWVQAKIWFEIEQYFNPPIRFRTLKEERDAGKAVEDIFNGPALDNGFIDDEDLEAAGLKTVLRGSDIINRLADIQGVIAVNQLRLTKYDSEGNAVTGSADPTWLGGEPVFDPKRLSAAWLLYIASRHQPRLYLNRSRFLFYKKGLPFLPRIDEARDTLNQLRGEAERPKNAGAENDLRIPRGEFREPDAYYPVQYSLPAAYGISRAGLPSHVTPLRWSHARNLKAYLMVFEQVLGNALAQLAHTADLFSLSPAIARTYFVKGLDETVINGFNDIAQPTMSAAAIEALVEGVPDFQKRRNGFLDHLLARFGEQFREYTLLLTDTLGRSVAQSRLIENKIAFLKRYPEVSRDRARAFNYALEPCSPDNYPGIKKRISLLLGYPDLSFAWEIGPAAAGVFPVKLGLVDGNGRHWLDAALDVAAADEAAAKRSAYRTLIEQMILPPAYDIAAVAGKFRLAVKDAASAELGRHPLPLDSREDAEALRDELLAWSANERSIVVEHLLLRPKFPGDALYPACCEGSCSTCGDEDPYSFRLTFVMPGWTARYTDNLDLRRFADRTIRQETPSHLLPKICWVANDGFIENPCDEVVTDLADLLMSAGLTAGGVPPTREEACECANGIYHAFSATFGAWYDDKKFSFFSAEALKTLIEGVFQTAPAPAEVICPTVFDAALWQKVQALMTAHFVGIALQGWQFERFEWAWCNWLDANAAIDWTEEKLCARVEAILAANVLGPAPQESAICECAHAIVTDYGAHFHDWMAANIATGATFETLTAFVPPPIVLCQGMSFKPGTAEAIAALLGARYEAYRRVSYWLWIVVTLLGDLRNVYPGATLHDCDDGSDHNPVRLDSTALGNYPLNKSVT